MPKKHIGLLLVFLSAAIPALLGTTLVIQSLYLNFRTSLVIGLITALVIGVLLSVEAHIFRNHSNRTCGLLTGMPLTGFAVGILAFLPASYSPHTPYLALEPPPEKATKFLQPSALNIFHSSIVVEAKSGNSYIYDCETFEGCTWIEITETGSVPEPDEDWGSCDPTTELMGFIPPKPPQGVIDSVTVCHNGPDFYIEHRYIMLEDGKLFAWDRFWSAGEALAGLTGFGLVGLVSGILSAIVNVFRKDPPMYAGPT